MSKILWALCGLLLLGKPGPLLAAMYFLNATPE